MLPWSKFVNILLFIVSSFFISFPILDVFWTNQQYHRIEREIINVDGVSEVNVPKEVCKETPEASQCRKKPNCCKRLFCCLPKDESYTELAKYKNGGTDYYPDSSIPPTALGMEEEEGADKEEDEAAAVSIKVRKRRTRIPDRPNYSLSLWSILKNAIGKDLSRIPMPVNFSEPLSMLQRLTEDLEYSEILDAAAKCDNSSEELCLVAAFTVSSYATTAVRTAKPFNPMLGETYECDRSDDKGWKCISEQVRHHPPTAAQHCEGRGWVMWQDFTMKSKFKGNYLEVVPLGIAHLVIQATGNHYSWRKVTTYVHNLVIGRLWVDQDGEMEIINHTNGDKCTLRYIPTTTFGKEQKKVTGVVQNKAEVIRHIINGYWDKYIECTEIKEQKLVDGKSDPTLKLVTEYGQPKRLWTRRVQPVKAEAYYNLTEFACQLNEPEDGVAPTDSRLRPDQRLMEEGKWDEANVEKVRLEEKQRSSRKKDTDKSTSAASKTNLDDDDGHEPLWFKKQKDPFSGMNIHVFQHTYWTQKELGDWSKCPNIF